MDGILSLGVLIYGNAAICTKQQSQAAGLAAVLGRTAPGAPGGLAFPGGPPPPGLTAPGLPGLGLPPVSGLPPPPPGLGLPGLGGLPDPNQGAPPGLGLAPQGVRQPPRRRPHTSCRDSRRRLNLLSYNCGGFTSAAWAEFTHWLDTQSYDVVVVQETHWQSEGCFTLPRWYCITAAAPTDDKYSGILVMVASKLACPEHIRYTVLHPGRLLHVKIGGLTVTHSSIDVLGVYQYVWRSTATKAENLANRAVIWNQLDKTATKLPVRNTRLVMGDLNTRPPPDLGLESRHLSNSGPQDADASKFRSFIDAANLMTLNTWSGPKAFTHQHAGHRTIIDYILADKDLADVQARRSAPMHHCPLASWKDSKHWPVAANVRLRQAWMHSRRARDTCSIDVQSLRYAVRHDAPEAAQLQVTVERKLRALTVPTTADQLHAAINACLLQACAEAFPLKAKQSADAPRQQALKRDISNSLQSLWAARRVLHEARKHTARALSDVALPRPLDAGDDDDGEGQPYRSLLSSVISQWRAEIQCQRLTKQLHKQSRQRRNARWQDIASQVQEADRGRDSQALHAALKKLQPWKPRTRIQFRDAQGMLLSPHAELDTLKRHCQSVFAVHAEPPPPATLKRGTAPTADELAHAILETGVNKAVPSDCAPAAVWRLAAGGIAQLLSRFLRGSWVEGASVDLAGGWKDTEMAFIPKPPKPPTQPQNLRPLGLISPPGKAIAAWVKIRLEEILAPVILTLPQFAYTAGRSTLDCLLRVQAHFHSTRKLISSMTPSIYQRREGTKSAPCYGGITLSVDLRGAFNEVPRGKLYQCLQLLRVDADLLTIVQHLHWQSRYFVHNASGRTSVTSSNGIKQGCRLAPSLWIGYTVVLLWSIRDVLGEDYMRACVTLFADDLLSSQTFSTRSEAMQCIHSIQVILTLLESMGMQINFDKTAVLLAASGPLHRKLRLAEAKPLLAQTCGICGQWCSNSGLPQNTMMEGLNAEMREIFGTSLPSLMTSRPSQASTGQPPLNPKRQRQESHGGGRPRQLQPVTNHMQASLEVQVAQLARVVMKHEDQINTAKLDRGFVFFMRNSEGSILQNLFEISQRTRQAYDNGQVQDNPLRILLLKALFVELEGRLKLLDQDPQALEKTKQQGLLGDQGWFYKRWDRKARKLVDDPQRTPLPSKEMATLLMDMFRLLNASTVLKFGASRGIHEEVLEDPDSTTVFLMEISLRGKAGDPPPLGASAVRTDGTVTKHHFRLALRERSHQSEKACGAPALLSWNEAAQAAIQTAQVKAVAEQEQNKAAQAALQAQDPAYLVRQLRSFSRISAPVALADFHRPLLASCSVRPLPTAEPSTLQWPSTLKDWSSLQSQAEAAASWPHHPLGDSERLALASSLVSRATDVLGSAQPAAQSLCDFYEGLLVPDTPLAPKPVSVANTALVAVTSAMALEAAIRSTVLLLLGGHAVTLAASSGRLGTLQDVVAGFPPELLQAAEIGSMKAYGDAWRPFMVAKTRKTLKIHRAPPGDFGGLGSAGRHGAMLCAEALSLATVSKEAERPVAPEHQVFAAVQLADDLFVSKVRLRKGRTKARTLLRSFVAGTVGWSEEAAKALATLDRHHSRSVLPQLVRRRLAFSQQKEEAMTTPWKCRCGSLNKLSAAYCPACGSPWQEAASSDAPIASPRRRPSVPRRPWGDTYTGGQPQYGKGWHAGGYERWESPRRRPKAGQRPKGPGKGQQPKGGKPTTPAKGVMNQAPAAAANQPPSAQQLLQGLPQAPTPAQPPVPSSQPSLDQGDKPPPALQELMSALAAQKESLSPGVQALLETHLATHHRSEEKAMHKLVQQQGKAKVELSNIRRARAQFAQEWHGYLQGLLDLLTNQVKAKNDSMTAYAEAEQMWEQQLQQTSRAIQQASGGPIEVASGDEATMDIQEQTVNDASEAEVARQTAVETTAAQEKSLMEALQQTAAAAQVQAQEYRERTPRRLRQGQQGLGSGQLPQPPSSENNGPGQAAGPSAYPRMIASSIVCEDDCVSEFWAPVLALCQRKEVILFDLPSEIYANPFFEVDPRLREDGSLAASYAVDGLCAADSGLTFRSSGLHHGSGEPDATDEVRAEVHTQVSRSAGDPSQEVLYIGWARELSLLASQCPPPPAFPEEFKGGTLSSLAPLHPKASLALLESKAFPTAMSGCLLLSNVWLRRLYHCIRRPMLWEQA
ncbi:putative 149 kDa protein [Symbiodinium microadriaticum]|uniref:Putative 149 kDa protein n=1 Tax=Symbiodinium microadriaticum TaxID=2951 RepID=A0A1Q9E1R3_SYMMI|nr:putative 149 kDa protein [Symbiodinium microadriaticum]